MYEYYYGIVIVRPFYLNVLKINYYFLAGNQHNKRVPYEGCGYIIISEVWFQALVYALDSWLIIHLVLTFNSGVTQRTKAGIYKWLHLFK